MDCPVCQTSAAPSARYCSFCGARLTVADHVASERQNESDRCLRSYVEHAPHGMFIANEQGRYVDVNDAACRITGYDKAELLRISIADTLPADYLDQGLAHFSRVREHGKAQAELPFIGRGGRCGWWSVETSKLSETRFICFVTDITERKRTEKALIAAHHRLRTILDSLFGFVGLYTLDGTLIEANRAPLEAAGLTRDEVIGQPFWETYWWSYSPEVQKQLRDALYRAAQGERVRYEVPVRVKNGAMITIDVMFAPLHDAAGKIDNIIGFAVDVTERNEIEQTLRRSEDRYRAIVEDQTEMIARWNFTDEITFVNGAVCRYLNLPREEILGKSFLPYVHESDIAALQAHLSSLTPEAPVGSIEHRLVLNGDIRWAHFSNRAIFDDSGRLVEFQSVGRDITARKQIEREVIQSRRLAEAALENLKQTTAEAKLLQKVCELAGQGVGMARMDGAFTYLNPTFRRLLDVSPDGDVSQVTFWEVVPQQDHRFLAETVLRTVRETGHWTGEFNLNSLSGHVFPAINNVFLLRDFDGEISGYANITTDLTERTRVEHALRTSEARFRQLVDESPNAMLMVDREGIITLVNRRLEILFGYADAELVGQAVEILVPDRFRENHPAFRAQFMSDPSPRAMGVGRDVYGLHRDGTEFPIEIVLSPLATANGVLPLAIITDVTNRKQDERKILDSLVEKEVLLREIHHRVKNNLQIISSLLYFQAKKVRDPQDLEVLREGRSRLLAMIFVHDTLYKSTNLSRLELAEYLHSLVGALRQSYEDRLESVTVRIEADRVEMPVDQALPAGMILCELLTNSFKHAFPDKRAGVIDVRLRLENGVISLIVSDNGIGLSDDGIAHQSETFGWRLIRTLCKQLAATIALDAVRGTQVTISFLQPQFREGVAAEAAQKGPFPTK